MINTIIDPHLHLFALDKGQYDWLKPEHPPLWPDKSLIYRDFRCQDLELNNEENGSPSFELKGFVHIEAGFDNAQPWREIDWLEQSVSLPFKSIACANLTQRSSEFEQTLSLLQQRKSVVGLRHILDEHVIPVLSHPETHKNLAKIDELGWIFEAQLDASNCEHVSFFIKTLSQFPNITFILNHAGFPPLHTANQWENNMKRLGKYVHCHVKVSGWEMVNRHYPIDVKKKRVAFLCHEFNSDHIMLASNFPLVLFQQSYEEAWREVTKLGLSKADWEKLTFQNANHIYQFNF